MYRNLEEYEKAFMYAKKSLSLKETLNDEKGILTVLIQIASLHQFIDNIDSAFYYVRKATPIIPRVNTKLENQMVNGLLGMLFLDTNNFDSSAYHADKAVLLAREYGDPEEETRAMIVLGAAYTGLKKYGEAESLLKDALGKSQEIGNLLLENYGHQKLSDLYRQQGNFRQALEHYEQFKITTDSLLNQKKVKQIEELNVQFETEKKDLEIANLKTEAQVHELEIANTRILVIAIVVVALLSIGLILYRNKQKGIRLKEELQKQRFKVVIEAEEHERKRVARELHDGLGQMLSTVRLFVSDMADRKINPKVDRSLAALDATIEEVRTISHNLMPRKLLDQGINVAIADMVEKINDSGKLKIRAHNIDLLHFDDSSALGIYRTIQEIINNAIKYAQAKTLNITAEHTATALIIAISDDGQGFNTEEIAKSKGIGWSNIFARIELLGGQVLVKSKSGRGTTVTLQLPSQKQGQLTA